MNSPAQTVAHGFEAGRLWSLWDVMERFDLSKFLFIFTHLSMLRQAMRAAAPLSLIIPRADHDRLKRDISTLRDELSSLGLRAASASARKLLETFDRAAQKNEMYHFTLDDTNLIEAAIKDIDSRARDELESEYVFFISAQKQELYKQESPLFGEAVARKFPSIAYEIEEAGKCLSLDRSTASAFHSIRALEAAIRALARCLAIPDPTKAADRSWFKSLGAISAEMQKRWPTTADRMNGDGRFFEEAHATLSAMQNPYRNSTMHLDQKYTEEEAEDIFNVIKAFMRKLASRLDEDGDPQA